MRPLLPRWFTARGQADGLVAAGPATIDLFARPAPPRADDVATPVAAATRPDDDATKDGATKDGATKDGATGAEDLVVTASIPPRRLVVPDPLRLIDGRLHLHLGDRLVCPLRHGDPFGLQAGWTAPALYVGCDRLLWLSLAHVDGHAANWFLTEAATYIADTVSGLPGAIRAGLVRHVQDLLATPPGPARDRALEAYGRMHLRTRREIELWIAADGDQATGAAGGPALAVQALPVLPPRPGALVPGIRLDTADLSGQSAGSAGAWIRKDGLPALLAGQHALITLPMPHRPTQARLSLEVTGLEVPRRLTVSVNGWIVGRSRIGPEHRQGVRLDYWIPAEALEAGRVTVGLDTAPASLEPAASMLLTHAALDLGPPLPEVADADDPAGLMAAFESLGEDCEFGFVQRRFGVEPLGLFRFAGAGHMRNLLRLVETDLAGLGEPGSLSTKLVNAVLYRTPDPPLVIPEFFMTDQRLGFSFHTFRGPEQETEAEAIAANERKLRYLKRKFIEDLEDGEKIWLLKDGSRGGDNEAFAFLDALQRKGRNRLFWVTRVVEGRPSGSVEWIAPNLLRGYSGGSHHDAQVFDAALWLRLCRNARRAFAERDALGAG